MNKVLVILMLLPLMLWASSSKEQSPADLMNSDPNQAAFAPSANAPETEYMPGQIVIKMKDEQLPLMLSKEQRGFSTQYPSINKLMDFHNISIVQKAFPAKQKPAKAGRTDLSKIYFMKFDGARDVLQVAEDFSRDPNVLYAEPVYIYKTSTTPDDPRYGEQGHFDAVQAEAAWDITQGSSDVIIGIVDSGVDLDHPDLAANIWVNEDEIPGNGIDDDGNGYVDDVYGWDFIGASFDDIVPDNDPDQDNGSDHGTHVAGIASAVGNNGVGVTGMGWNMKILVTKHSSDDPSISIGYGYSGIVYCADNGADIINCSWGGGGYSQYAQDVINYAYEQGALVVGAAGNDTPDASYNPPQFCPPHYPSAYDHVLSVSATDNIDRFTSFSYYGTTVDVAAPGSAILSTIPVSQGSYTRLSGTSMSSPLVAGVAGLVKSVYPDMTPDQITNQIKYTSDNIDDIGTNSLYVQYGGIGEGRVNAYRAVSEAPQPFVEITSVFYDDSIGGNNNGKAEPGESIDIRLSLSNLWGDVSDLVISVSSDDYGIVVDDNTSILGSVPGGTTSFSNDEDLMRLTVSEDALPHRVPLEVTISGSGGYIREETIYLSIEPMVLIVDDDDGFNNVEEYYTHVLDQMGIVYDIWDHNSQGSPEGILASYPNVIWVCEWNFPSLDADDRQIIQQYLGNGGKMFLSGQDIGWDLSDAGSDINEYAASGGASRTFFNSYLKAKYIRDDSDFDELTGVEGDPIGDGLEFEIFQPGRTGNQYPSEISPLGDAVSLFQYPNGNDGAIRYEGDYRLVFFAFGGYEAITDSLTRKIVMGRIIRWLNGIDFQHVPLRDTEDTENDYTVEIALTSVVDSLADIDLYWDTDGTLPFNKVPMIKQESGLFDAKIPAQAGGNIQYMIFARTNSGTYLPSEVYHFVVGPDEQPPSLEIIRQPNAGTANPVGPFVFEIESEDNIGVDKESAQLLYWKEGMPADTVLLNEKEENIYGSRLYFDPALEMGAEMYYTFQLRDISLTGNEVRSDTFTFRIDSIEVLDDFEGSLTKWDLGESWGKTSKISHDGTYSLADNPEGNYQDNQDNPLTYRLPHRLQNYQSAWLDMWVKYDIYNDKDFVFVEVSVDGGSTWNEIKQFTGTKLLFFNEIIYLNDYVGPAQDSLMLRFRLESDSIYTRDGFYLDDLVLRVSDSPPTSIAEMANAVVPADFYLNQNYPNPFNPSTVIEFGVKSLADIKLNIYNVLGQKVAVLANEAFQPGRYRVNWDGRNVNNQAVGSGVYIYHLEVRSKMGEKRDFYNKMILVH